TCTRTSSRVTLTTRSPAGRSRSPRASPGRSTRTYSVATWRRSADESARHVLARDACLVRGCLRRADPGAGARLAGDRPRRAHADPSADRLGEDAGRVPLRNRQAQPGAWPGPAVAVRLAAQG